MRTLLVLLAGLTGAALVAAGASGQSARDDYAGALTTSMVARALAEVEAQVAVGKVGVKVCRQLTLGIAVPDWIRGVVVEVGRGNVGVRIDDPGRFSHELNGVAIERGTVIRDAVTAWTPCF